MSVLSEALDWLNTQLQEHAAPTETVDLEKRTGEGTYSAGVPWLAYTIATTTKDETMIQAAVGDTWRKFQLWKVGQTVLPKALDRITQGSSKWQVKKIESIDGVIFDCLCLEEV